MCLKLRDLLSLEKKRIEVEKIYLNYIKRFFPVLFTVTKPNLEVKIAGSIKYRKVKKNDSVKN